MKNCDYKRNKMVKAFIVRIKCSPCIDCHNYYNPWVMMFDHRNPKEKKFVMPKVVSAGYSMAKLVAEIAKCDLVCSNCHADRTYRQQVK